MTAPTTLLAPDVPFEDVGPVRREVPRLLRADRPPPRGMVVLAVLAALVAAAVAVASAAGDPGTWTVSTGVLTVTEGTELVEAGTEVERDALLPLDVELVVGEAGAVVTRGDDLTVEVTPGAVLRFRDGEDTSRPRVVLVSGSVLLRTEQFTPVDVEATPALVTGLGGAFRVERDESPRVATYGASVIVADPPLSLQRLRQVPLGGAAGQVAPIVLDPSDPWDQRFAATALATDEQVEQLRAGLEATYGTAPQTAAFYADFVGVTEGLVDALPRLAAVEDGDRFGPPADTLIAAASLTALAEGTGRPLDTLVPRVITDRADGGTWGVILAAEDLDATYLRSIADDALRRRAQQPEPEPVIVDEPEQPTEPVPQPTPEPSPSPTPEPSPSPTPEPTSSPTPEPSPSPTPGPIDEPIETIEDLITPGGDGVIDPLGEFVDPAGDSSVFEGMRERIGDLIDGVLAVLGAALP